MEKIKRKCPGCKRTKLLNENNFEPIEGFEGGFIGYCRLCWNKIQEKNGDK